MQNITPGDKVHILHNSEDYENGVIKSIDDDNIEIVFEGEIKGGWENYENCLGVFFSPSSYPSSHLRPGWYNESEKTSSERIKKRPRVTTPQDMTSGISDLDESIELFEAEFRKVDLDLPYYHLVVTTKIKPSVCKEIQKIYEMSGWGLVECNSYQNCTELKLQVNK